MNGPRTVSRDFNICHFVQLCNCYYVKDQRWVQLFIIWPWFVLLHGRWQMKSFSFQILTQSACALEIDGLLIYVIIWQYIYYGHGQNMGENRRGMIPLWQTGDPKAKCQGLEFRIWTLRYKNFQSTFIRVTPALSCTHCCLVWIKKLWWCGTFHLSIMVGNFITFPVPWICVTPWLLQGFCMVCFVSDCVHFVAFCYVSLLCVTMLCDLCNVNWCLLNTLYHECS